MDPDKVDPRGFDEATATLMKSTVLSDANSLHGIADQALAQKYSDIKAKRNDLLSHLGGSIKCVSTNPLEFIRGRCFLLECNGQMHACEIFPGAAHRLYDLVMKVQDVSVSCVRPVRK